MSAMGRKQPSALASYQIPRANTITSLPQILFPICHPTFAPTRGRARLLTEVQRSSSVAVGRAVSRHFSLFRGKSTLGRAFLSVITALYAVSPSTNERFALGGSLVLRIPYPTPLAPNCVRIHPGASSGD